MKTQVLLALFATVNSVQIRNTPATATTATATAGVAAAAGSTAPPTAANGGLPTTAGPPMCPTAPPATNMNPPATMNCGPSAYIAWTANATGGGCNWTCVPDPAAPPQPSESEQITQFVQGFFGMCDLSGDSTLTKKEIKKCMKRIVNQTKQGMQQGLKQQKKQMQDQVQWQTDMYDHIFKMIWNGAWNTTTTGITQTEVVAWLHKGTNWGNVSTIINTPPPMQGGPSGPQAPPPSGGSTTAPPLCHTAPSSNPPETMVGSCPSGQMVQWLQDATSTTGCFWGCAAPYQGPPPAAATAGTAAGGTATCPSGSTAC